MRKSASQSRLTDFRIAFAAACVMATLAFAGPAFAATKNKPAPAAAPAASEAQSQPMAALTPTTTLERIKGAGKIVLGYRPDAAPMSYRDASGQPAGYSVALCNKVADALKRDLSLSSAAVEWVAVGANFADLEQHRVDLVCAGDEVTLANRAKASFSIPIFPGGVSALVRADAAEPLQRALEERRPAYRPLWRGTPPPTLEHRTYAALVGSTTIDELKSRIAGMRLTANVEPVDNYDAGVAAVVKGRTDVLFGDRAQLLQAVQRSAQIAKDRERLVVPADAAAVAKLAPRYTNPSLGEVAVEKKGAAAVFDVGEWKSAVASRKNDDGTISFITIDPTVSGFEFVVADSAGAHRLITRDAQHEYVFAEAKAPKRP